MEKIKKDSRLSSTSVTLLKRTNNKTHQCEVSCTEIMRTHWTDNITKPHTRISVRTFRKTTWKLDKVALQYREAFILYSCIYLSLWLYSLQWGLSWKNRKAKKIIICKKENKIISQSILWKNWIKARPRDRGAFREALVWNKTQDFLQRSRKTNKQNQEW